jgi:hypothetical protein
MPENNQAALFVAGPTWQRLLKIHEVSKETYASTLKRAMELLTDAVVGDERLKYPPQRNAPLPARYERPLMLGGVQVGMYLSAFKTAKQQRYFFWALKAGEIRVPYKRKHSAGLGGAIGATVWAENDHVVGLVGINELYAPYARLVVGDDDEQALYHQGHWWQFEPTVIKIAAERQDEMIEVAIAELVARLV